MNNYMTKMKEYKCKDLKSISLTNSNGDELHIGDYVKVDEPKSHTKSKLDSANIKNGRHIFIGKIIGFHPYFVNVSIINLDTGKSMYVKSLNKSDIYTGEITIKKRKGVFTC